MNAKILVASAVSFIIGAAIAHIYTKRKYEILIDEEIDSVKKEFSKKYKCDNHNEETYDPEDEEIVSQGIGAPPQDTTDYTQYSTRSSTVIISAEEYGEIEDYELIQLEYYSNGILVDIHGDPVTGLLTDEMVEEITHTEETLYIRNHTLKSDYEIDYNADEF